MSGRGHIHAAAIMIGLMSGAAMSARAAGPEAIPAVTPPVSMTPVRFAELPGWLDDDHAAAFTAFLRSCGRVLAAGSSNAAAGASSAPLLDVCRKALARADRGAGKPAAMAGNTRAKIGRAEARVFFQQLLVPHRVVHAGGQGLLTGYYEPELEGSRVATARFRVPLYRRPPDLENVVDETRRGAPGIGFTHMRRTPQGPVPYATRTEIDRGALAGQGLELIWLADPVDAFFLQIQGSGRVRFPDGTAVRITYDGKNGHPYTSVGRHLIDQGVIGADSMTLDRLGAYLRADEQRGRAIMQQNASFVFFRELAPAEGDRALGAMGIGLTAGRSLAVDASVHTLGTPIYVVAPTLRHAVARRPFQRLMVAQDVGSAIRGPERGDIYFGSGARAGALAGVTKQPGHFFVLLPRSALAAGQPK